MAITYVGGKAAGVAGSTATDTTVDLSTGLTGGSNTGVSADDLVIVNYSVGIAGTVQITIRDPSSVAYPLVTANNAQVQGSDNNDAMMRVGYKFMPSTPDASVILGPTGATSDQGAYAIHVWRGVSKIQTFDNVTTTAVGNNTSRPNPPAITPRTSDAMIVCCAAGAAADASVAFTFASANNLLQSFNAGTVEVRAAILSRTTVTRFVAVDQAASTTGSATTADSWAALTMSLRASGSEISFLPPVGLSSFRHLLVR